jgi:hypothetical protein
MTEIAATPDSTRFRNAFIGQVKEPTDGELTEVLGAAKALWDVLVAGLTGAARPSPRVELLFDCSCSPIAVHRKHDDKWLFP